MTKDYYERIVGFDNLDRWEEMAASKNMTGIQLAELMIEKAVQGFDEIESELGSPCNAAITQVSGNVIQVNFSAAAADSWSRRKAHQEPSKRRKLANRISVMPIRVPSASPSPNSAAVPCTSPDTGITYSSS